MRTKLFAVPIIALVSISSTMTISAQPDSEQSERTVNILQEPRHRTVHTDGNLRVLDVQINPGDTTLPHTHDSAILYTFISNGTGALNGRVSSTTSYVNENYTHSVNNPGPELFRIIALANYGPAVVAGAGVQIDLSPQLENEWFRSYRLELAPGQSSASYLHTFPVLIVQVTEGLVHVSRADGITSELDAMGDWAWRDAGTAYQIHNRGDQPVSVVINEGKR